jgi:histidyl-tRNA synthetase
LNEEALIWSATAADRLRKAGASVACAFSTRSLKSLLKDADRKNAQVAVIVGESEMANRTATIRDLATGDQQSVAFNNLTSIVNQQK